MNSYTKLTVAFFAAFVSVGFAACTTAPMAPKKVMLTPCGEQNGKIVILNDSYSHDDARVVHLVH